ncbi:hypothetical protein FPQ18DRAFT_146841 [Pyronema domesticum]|nr:hypothetical protein FPQ18DRAFT_146841 [Pyronema domesticum]
MKEQMGRLEAANQQLLDFISSQVNCSRPRDEEDSEPVSKTSFEFDPTLQSSDVYNRTSFPANTAVESGSILESVLSRDTYHTAFSRFTALSLAQVTDFSEIPLPICISDIPRGSEWFRLPEAELKTSSGSKDSTTTVSMLDLWSPEMASWGVEADTKYVIDEQDWSHTRETAFVYPPMTLKDAHFERNFNYAMDHGYKFITSAEEWKPHEMVVLIMSHSSVSKPCTLSRNSDLEYDYWGDDTDSCGISRDVLPQNYPLSLLFPSSTSSINSSPQFHPWRFLSNIFILIYRPDKPDAWRYAQEFVEAGCSRDPEQCPILIASYIDYMYPTDDQNNPPDKILVSYHRKWANGKRCDFIIIDALSPFPYHEMFKRLALRRKKTVNLILMEEEGRTNRLIRRDWPHRGILNPIQNI